FQQTNVVGGEISEGTGGITEGLRTRVVMPHTGSYWDTHHVLGHEIVHVFQYNIAEAGPGGLNRLGALPLWLVEGMAEYLSLGRNDALTAMWLRDATLRDKLPTLKQLTTDPRFFPYRYGQAFWAYVAGRYGDRAVVDVYRAALRVGWDQALVRVLGVNQDSLSKDWISSIKTHYQPLLADRTLPKDAGEPVLRQRKGGGDYNLAPTVSPDGKYVAFFSRRGLFTIDLFVADAATGRIVKRLAGPTSDSHFDAISFISSSGDWSPDGRKFAFIAFAQGDHEVAILDVNSTDIERRIKLPGIGAVNNVAWSPDGRTLALSGMKGGISDLYLLDAQGGQLRQLTSDRHADIHPAWSPDSRTIAFATDRGARTSFDRLTFSPLQLATIDVATAQVTVRAPFPNAKQINPQFAPDGQSIFFISDQDGFSDIYRMALATGATNRVTRLATGVSGITHTSPAMSVARGTGRLLFSVFDEQGWGVYGLDAARTVGTPATPAAVATGGILPPGDTPGRSIVSTYL
ncbi:MAG TPA: basic secretory protein-like protein, partial [Gemmatimonadaceae bacterium]|nr:basic secretory protein-like protein [Gemmatimonadaceae bacterium]